MAYSAMQVANAFIQKAIDGQIATLTPMKLQKLMFFAQSWYIKNFRSRLIDDNFMRWPYGPVIPSVYYEFKDNGGGEITELAKMHFQSRRQLIYQKKMMLSLMKSSEFMVGSVVGSYQI